MQCNSNRTDTKSLTTRFARDVRGAVIVYVTIIMLILFGIAAFAIDFARLFTTASEAKAAADAAAIAAASQLVGSNNSFVRATNAAINTPLVSNRQNFSQTAAADGSIVIANIRFLDDLPANDASPITAAFETTDPTQARFVEVTTEVVSHTNMFASVLAIFNPAGTYASSTFTTASVAGNNPVICRVTPMMICNPNEINGVGAPFDTGNWAGRQVVAKDHKGGGSWAPGNWGFLDAADFGNGANALAENLATTEPPEVCFGARVDLRPGAVTSVRTAFNVRFDMYDNPHFGGNAKNQSKYRPARNVTKGKVRQGGASCGNLIDSTPITAAMGMPRDTTFTQPPANQGIDEPRFGNGQWNCDKYWKANHGGASLAGCEGPATNTWTRFDIYRHEIDSGKIPSSGNTGSVEDGNPQCYGGSTTPNDLPDRRVLFLAVINCVEQGINGNESNVPTVAFIRTFMTEPVADPSGSAGSDVVLEIVDVVQAGQANGVFRNVIQLYR